MQKKLVWFFLLLKVQICKKETWVLLGIMFLFLLLIQRINIPQKDNKEIVICNLDESEMAKKLVQQLLETESVFHFTIVENEEKLEREVYKGNGFCGFIINEDFGRKLKQGRQDGVLTYVCSAETAKGKIAKETMYAKMFSVYSECLLMKNAKTLSLEKEELFAKELLKVNETYLNSDELFYVDTLKENFETITEPLQENKKVYPVQGMIALFILVAMMLVRGENMEKSRMNLLNTLLPGERVVFQYLQYLVMGLLMGVVGITHFFVKEKMVQAMLQSISLIIYIFICAVWMLLVQKIFKKENTYYSWIMTIILANTMIAPVFWDLSMYIPFLRVLQNLFPVGFYINILNAIG